VQRQLSVFIPIFNGTYFTSMFKVASEISAISDINFIFFFGRSYPGQERHLFELGGKFEYSVLGLDSLRLFKNSRICSLLRRIRFVDEFFLFFELVNQSSVLKKRLRAIWAGNEVDLCLFPADNRYFYPSISRFAHLKGTPVIVIPQWFASSKEIEESLGTSKIYRPNLVEQTIIRIIAPKYLKYVTVTRSTFKMIPIRFSQIVFAWMDKHIPPEPWILHSGFSERIFVETPSAYAFATDLGFKSEQLSLTGSVYLDEINRTKFKSQKAIRLLVAIAPDMFLSRRHAELTFSSYDEYLNFVCSELIDLGYPDAVISLHPSDSGRYNSLIKNYGFTISQEPLHLLLTRAQIFLATISATIQWADYLGVPTVNFDFYRYRYPDYANLESVFLIEDRQELKSALNQAGKISEMNQDFELESSNVSQDNYTTSLERILAEIDFIYSKFGQNDYGYFENRFKSARTPTRSFDTSDQNWTP